MLETNQPYDLLFFTYVSCRAWLSVEIDVSLLQPVRSAANRGVSWTSCLPTSSILKDYQIIYVSVCRGACPFLNHSSISWSQKLRSSPIRSKTESSSPIVQRYWATWLTFLTCLLSGVAQLARDVSLLQLVQSAANSDASWTSLFANFKYFERLSDHRCFGLPRGCFQPASAGLKSSTFFAGRCDGILRRWPYHCRVHSAIWTENSVCCVVCSK